MAVGLPLLLFLLFLSAAYIYTFPTPNVFYAAIVGLHAALGLTATIALAFYLLRRFRTGTWPARVAWFFVSAGAVLGIALLFTGTTRPYLRMMYAHVLASLIGIALLVSAWSRARGWLASNRAVAVVRVAIVLAIFAGLAAVAWSTRESRWLQRNRIANPTHAPATMDAEGDGPRGPFFPSSAQTADGRKIPGRFFMESQACKRCHEDIFNQWNSSAHHFSSFNNQWYRKSIEYMQEVVGTRPSKWCGGCHDPAVLFSGLMDTPIKEIVDRPEAQAGLGCVMCHSIAQVKSTMGQGDFVLEYPQLHDLAATDNPIVRVLHDYLINLNPEPHRRVFLKPFMRTQTADFCSTCHKVHLDVPVNHYRWIRGFNEYDNWQASGVSGFGARSFYYPPKSQKCADCHMPLVASRDAGNIQGKIHSHSFPGANTALPVANADPKQLALTEKFLKDKIVSLDIFALSTAPPAARTSQAQQSEMATTFAVGEEAEVKTAAAVPEQAAPVTAPLNRVRATVRRGDTARVDVVVRTRKVGHFFPGGTVDAFDVWVELKATDNKGQTLFWSGMVEDNGKGPVEKGAHFYRSLMVDAHGNPINKRNAWSTRALVYVRLVPPGAADTVHYRLNIPENAGDQIKLQARLCYRKFAWWNTQFSFAGVAHGAEYTSEFDDRQFVFTGDTSRVSGQLKRIPDLPIVSLAEDEVTLAVAPKGSKAQAPQTALEAGDWTRWNDYGIGLLLQGDLRAAQAAFQKVTEIDPKNPDGWVNLGRVSVQEGDMERAREVLQRALALKPDLARAQFFYARVLRSDGNYEEAADHLRKVVAQYPRDRVVRNDLGRILFLQRRYADAIKEFEAVFSIDPEDLQAHYNLMLCYKGLGQNERAQEHERRYRRFKADEAAQALTGPYRRLHPEDNNERQTIHEHVSVALKPSAPTAYGNLQAERRSRPRNPANSAAPAQRGGGE